MAEAHPSDAIISEHLTHILANTRLSMDQVAKKWHVSCAMLSQIKNNKKSVGVDLGLKILREAGVDADTRKEWLESRFFSKSEEFERLAEGLHKNRQKKLLSSSFSSLIENNLVLMDIFLDITIAQEEGIHRNTILKYHGEEGLSQIKPLLDSEIVRREGQMFYIVSENFKFVTNEASTFGIIRNILEQQRRKTLEGTFNGELNYDVSDIDEEGLEKLIKINLEYQTKTQQILNQHRKHRLKGGIRVFTQSIVSTLKNQITLMSLLLFALMHLSLSSYAQGLGGNVSGNGGNSSRVLQGVELPGVDYRTRRVNLSRFKTMVIDGHGAKIGNIEMTFKKSHVSTDHYDTKEEAIEAAKTKQIEIATDFNYQKAKDEFGRFHKECFKSLSQKLGYDDPNFFRFRGFEIKESFQADGTPRYKAQIRIDFLCQE